jgi:predicted butyrate kinase (DUF1464 family)
MLRVAGADPGTSSLDLLILEDGAVADQCRINPDELRADPQLPVHWLRERGPFALIAGPSGYGLPLIRAQDSTERELALMALVRPGDPASGQGVLGFTALLRALQASNLPVVFLPGVIHLPTVPAHRKINRIDLGTADKLCVAALALAQLGEPSASACVIELGSVFTACLVLSAGQLVDAVGGTSGPPGWQAGGAWDGEAAYLLAPLEKRDLFAGGVRSVPDGDIGHACFRERLIAAVAGLQAITPFDRILLSGRLLESESAFVEAVSGGLTRFGSVSRLPSLTGAWVKHAAQGAALVADGLAGGTHKRLVERLALREASGTVLDWLCYPGAEELRRQFLGMGS